MTISKLVLHVKADIIYRLKNDIMEDCFLFFCCSDQQFLSSALTQQFNSLTRLFFLRILSHHFQRTNNFFHFNFRTQILLVSASKTDGLSDVHSRAGQIFLVAPNLILPRIPVSQKITLTTTPPPPLIQFLIKKGYFKSENAKFR